MAGTFLDGIPEGVVLGLSVLHHGAPGLGTVAAYFLANILEALSSSAGMRRAGRSARYVFGVWIGIALITGLAAGATGLVLRGTGPAVRGTLEAFAAGVILALVSQTMIPEAFHGSTLAAGCWFCGLTDPAGTEPLKSFLKDSVMPSRPRRDPVSFR